MTELEQAVKKYVDAHFARDKLGFFDRDNPYQIKFDDAYLPLEKAQKRANVSTYILVEMINKYWESQEENYENNITFIDCY